MIKKQDLLLKSDFIKNVFTLLSGATIAQIIALIAIPILTRIYTPEDFGFIAIYLSITNIIAAISTGRFELAIMLPKKKENALAIFKGTYRIVLITSLVSVCVIFIIKSLNNNLSDFIKPTYFFFLPLSIFIVGMISVFIQWYNRQKQFRFQAKTKIVKSSSNSIINISLGFALNLNSVGLFFGHIAGQAMQLIMFVSNFFKEEKENLKTIDRSTIKKQLKENRNFPYFSAPMAFLNAISVDILIYVLNLFYSTSLVGLY
ncbi:lipopolysaccharide biosynthesis protein, partial [Bacteroidota bacterium]